MYDAHFIILVNILWMKLRRLLSMRTFLSKFLLLGEGVFSHVAWEW